LNEGAAPQRGFFTLGGASSGIKPFANAIRFYVSRKKHPSTSSSLRRLFKIQLNICQKKNRPAAIAAGGVNLFPIISSATSGARA
jgi:hypothetical protein